MKAILISIGDELLIGQTINTNASWMGEKLNSIGVNVLEIVTVADNKKAITDSLYYAHAKADLVIITGGLGPTKDDITKATLCEYFNTRLIVNQDVLKKLEEFFAIRKRPMLESNSKQAEIPEKCTMIENHHGTAQGMWFEENNIITISLPGVPYEMKGMMEDYILPELEKRNKFSIVQRTLLTTGIGESFLAEKIKTIEDELHHDGLSLAYLPSLGVLKLRITAKGNNILELKNKVDQYFEKIKVESGDYYFDEGNGSLEEFVAKLLVKKTKTLSVVESCTGGKIANMLTAIPGASTFFNGSVTAYAYSSKENILHLDHNKLLQVGAVSEWCAIELAKGGLKLFNTDYCISTTGIAGPTGGTENKPVGTVWVGFASKELAFAKCFHYGSNRERNITLSAHAALNLLRMELLK